MAWCGAQSRPLVEAAIAAAAGPPPDLPAGEHEIRIGIDGAAAGLAFSCGMHGRLTVGRRARPLEELLTVAIAAALDLSPPAARRKIVELAARADQEPSDAGLRDARKIVRGVKRRLGVSWRETPTFKPRD
jgi:hypothetical protein